MAFSFFITGVTGVFLFADFYPLARPHAWKELHQWMGLLFLTGAATHIIYNWRGLLRYFKLPRGVVSWGLALLICLALSALFLLGGGKDDGRHDGPRGNGLQDGRGPHGPRWGEARGGN